MSGLNDPPMNKKEDMKSVFEDLVVAILLMYG